MGDGKTAVLVLANDTRLGTRRCNQPRGSRASFYVIRPPVRLLANHTRRLPT